MLVTAPSGTVRRSVDVEPAYRSDTDGNDVEGLGPNLGIVVDVEPKHDAASVLDRDVLGDERRVSLPACHEPDVTADDLPRDVPHRLECRPIHGSQRIKLM